MAGKVAVVTGAASGIGRALAETFAGAGMHVVVADIEAPALEKAADALRDRGTDVLAVRTDVSKADSVEALAEAAYERFGAVHVVCNNAGVAGGGLSWEVSLEDWEWVLGVDLMGVVYGVRSFVPRMIAGGQPGHIVNTASMAGLTSAPFMGPYNVAKHGVVTLSETMVKEFAATGNAQLGISVLCPGWVRTNINTSDRNRPEAVGVPDLAAGAAPEVEAPAMLRDALNTLIDSGIDPLEVGRQVLEAIFARRFYVLTHPWQGMIKTRMEDILEDRIPAVDFFPGVLGDFADLADPA